MSAHSARSVRIRNDARNRPDVLWRDNSGWHEERLEYQSSPAILQGGNQLAQDITEADTLLEAMRNIAD